MVSTIQGSNKRLLSGPPRSPKFSVAPPQAAAAQRDGEKDRQKKLISRFFFSTFFQLLKSFFN